MSNYLTSADLVLICNLLTALGDCFDGSELCIADVELIDINAEPCGKVGYREAGFVFLPGAE